MHSLRLAFLLTLTSAAAAQQPDTAVVVPSAATLGEVTVEASREGDRLREAAYAVTVLRPSPQAGGPVFSLAGVLGGLPGVYASDRANAALGERLSVRGMGARSAFGVRGVYVLLDGVPLTMPDGQAVLDIVEPTSLTRVEAVRGPASSLWGNGSGGVVAFSTRPDVAAPQARLRASIGSYGQRAVDAQVRVIRGMHRIGVYMAHERQDGYRAHSRYARTRVGTTGQFRLGTRTLLDASGAVFLLPLADSPGPLTRAEFDADPRQAAARYVATDAGKTGHQVQAGAGLTHQTRVGRLRVNGWGLARGLDNPLPFAYIRLDRRAGGASVHLLNDGRHLDWSAGVDASAMRDERSNVTNQQGAPGDPVLLDQREAVRNRAAFARLRLRRGRFGAHGGLRYDRIGFEARDRLLSNGDASGTRRFGAWSPSAGSIFDLGPAVAFASVSAAFETPTTTELTNRADGVGGFNPSLRPQHTRGGEAGLRGRRGLLAFDVAVYRYAVRGLIAPFQTEAGGGRTFYRNDGDAQHTGVEGTLGVGGSDRGGARLTYSYTRARFVGGASAGQGIPGAPAHVVHAEVSHTYGPLRLAADLDAASGYPADDAGSARTEGYAVLNLHAGGRFRAGAVQVLPFLSFRNVSDSQYAGAVTVNAAGGRAFEPAPGRAVTVGMAFELK